MKPTPCRRALLGALLVLVACGARAERVFLGVVEADSYQSVVYGAAAFSRVSDLPVAVDLVNDALARHLCLPGYACLNPNRLLRVVLTLDPDQPPGALNPASVALIPLAGGPQAALDLFAAAYASRRESGPFAVFEGPADTNRAASVYVAAAEQHLLTARSAEALAWAWQNRARLLEAPAQALPGTLRLLVNPQRLAELLGARADPAAVLAAGKRLADFDDLAFSLGLDGQAFALALRGRPKPETPLAAFAAALRQPRPALWHAPPDDAFFSLLGAHGDPGAWRAFLDARLPRLFRPTAPLVPDAAFCGDAFAALTPADGKKGLCLVQLRPVTNAAAVGAALARLDTVPSEDGLVLTREPSRLAGGLEVHRYALAIRPAAAGAAAPAAERSLLLTLTALFLKEAYLEIALADGCLVSAVGPERSLDLALACLAARERPLTLQRRLALQDPLLGDAPLAGVTLGAASLLRHLVAGMPGVRPEHLRVLPAGGGGAALGLAVDARGQLTASLRVQSTEIAALQRINRDGREVLQELFFQMFSNQLLSPQRPAP